MSWTVFEEAGYRLLSSNVPIILQAGQLEVYNIFSGGELHLAGRFNCLKDDDDGVWCMQEGCLQTP